MPRREQLGSLRRGMLRIPVPWVFVLAYLAGAALEAAFHTGRWLEFRYLTPAGWTVFAMGATFAGWSWLMFYRAGTTRVPGEFSTALVTRGPYRMTRNPMYVGLAVAHVGEACILHQLIPVVLLPAVIAYLGWVVIPVEEQRLRAAFGADYDAYARKVGRWI